jgi:hypothetical protein
METNGKSPYRTGELCLDLNFDDLLREEHCSGSTEPLPTPEEVADGCRHLKRDPCKTMGCNKRFHLDVPYSLIAAIPTLLAFIYGYGACWHGFGRHDLGSALFYLVPTVILLLVARHFWRRIPIEVHEANLRDLATNKYGLLKDMLTKALEKLNAALHVQHIFIAALITRYEDEQGRLDDTIRHIERRADHDSSTKQKLEHLRALRGRVRKLTIRALDIQKQLSAVFKRLEAKHDHVMRYLQEWEQERNLPVMFGADTNGVIKCGRVMAAIEREASPRYQALRRELLDVSDLVNSRFAPIAHWFQRQQDFHRDLNASEAFFQELDVERDIYRIETPMPTAAPVRVATESDIEAEEAAEEALAAFEAKPHAVAR